MPVLEEVVVEAPVTIDPVSAGLERAAEIVRKRWCQGHMLSPNGLHCAVGALHVAAGYYARGDGAGDCVLYNNMSRRLHKVIGSRGIMAWNDTKGRTKEEVVAALQAAARI